MSPSNPPPPDAPAGQSAVRPGDVARWLFWVQARKMLPVARPALVRSVLPLWRLQHLAAGAGRELMADEYRRSFGDVGETAVEDAYRVAFRAHYEELLLGKLTVDNWRSYLQFQDQAHLDDALTRKKGAIILFPHAGNFMMMIAAVSLAGYPYTQYAARGLAPAEVAAEHPELFGHNWFRAETRRVREESEDRLPARFLTMETPLRQLFRRLAENEIVGIAFDGRIGNKFMKVPYLGREALLNPGPYRMAIATGAAIVPTMVECPAVGPDICHFGAPIVPDGHTPESLAAAYVTVVEQWLRAHPEQYGTWLLHCRLRNAVDDHPLFVDYAPDDRWRRYDTKAEK
ncbi:MAG: lysophospholipid acyltransferase family protein [Pseudomonadota bacterium]|nr:lysophospholipid acyltransferase family protein [Pseudomonadota bacterium]